VIARFSTSTPKVINFVPLQITLDFIEFFRTRQRVLYKNEPQTPCSGGNLSAIGSQCTPPFWIPGYANAGNHSNGPPFSQKTLNKPPSLQPGKISLPQISLKQTSNYSKNSETFLISLNQAPINPYYTANNEQTNLIS